MSTVVNIDDRIDCSKAINSLFDLLLPHISTIYHCTLDSCKVTITYARSIANGYHFI
ncbi:hypothetical protein Plhal304r1_c060g0146901 [Plasmopara halstedii]